MLGPSYSGLTRSLSWLLMPWLLVSPGHQHSWYWLCGVGKFLSLMRKMSIACVISVWRMANYTATTVYSKKYAHGFVVLCFVVVMQSFITNSHEVFTHFHQGCFAGTGAIVRLPQCQWSKPDGYGKISQCITTTKHSKAKTVCIFLGIYCTLVLIHVAVYFMICLHDYWLIDVFLSDRIL